MSKMTRKEAIKILKREHEILTDAGNITKVSEALRLAISSLETDEAYQLEYERTTKNDLGVENDLVSSIVEEISEQVTETHEEFIFETIRPYCENVVQMKISKRDLEQALLKYYGKNDLGVDCISRAEARKTIIDHQYSDSFCEEHNIDHSINTSMALIALSDLPSVTPQEPILDKIRAEIKTLPIAFTSSFDMKQDCLEILDKYKAESEDKE